MCYVTADVGEDTEMAARSSVDIKIPASLSKSSSQRTQQDLDNIYAYLKKLEALSSNEDDVLRQWSATATYECHPSHSVLYRANDVANSWYLLLSGTVLVGQVMFISNQKFGERLPGHTSRTNECITLEQCQLLSFPYESQRSATKRDNVQLMNNKRISRHLSDVSLASSVGDDSLSPLTRFGRRDNAFATSSETSSLSSNWSYALTAGMDDDQMSTLRSSGRNLDLSGLEESNVDSDEEDMDSVKSESMGVDPVRECLEKDPADRTDDEIDALLVSIQNLKAFSNLPLTTRRALCSEMVFAVIDKADTVVMSDGEELDSWCVIMNGMVEVVQSSGVIVQLELGDSFGVKPTGEKQFHQGTMYTKVDDCQFICIPHQEYNRILHESEENMQRLKENGRLVLITEHLIGDEHRKRQKIILRGTAEKLIEQLKDVDEVTDTYLADFLLMYRAFIKNTVVITDKLLEWFQDPLSRDKVCDIILEWINRHFEDFEIDSNLREFLDKFQTLLEERHMKSQLRLVQMACTFKAQKRTVVLTRAKREDSLNFLVLGGTERGCGLFITKVEPGSKAAEVGLKRGDQILEVNNQNFENISHNKALDILRGSTHLSITVRSNIIAFNEMLEAPSIRPPGGAKKQNGKNSMVPDSAKTTSPVGPVPVIITPPFGASGAKGRLNSSDGPANVSAGLHAGGTSRSNKIRRALARFNLLPMTDKSESRDGGTRGNRLGVSGATSPVLKLRLSSSHPDLTSIQLLPPSNNAASLVPEHCLRVFKADHTCKYLPVHKETTAHEVVMLALREFGITESSNNYCLCEVTVHDGVVKQRRLPDQLNNLADRCSFHSRHYIKNTKQTDQVLPDHMVDDIKRESQLNFLQLSCLEVATQLTLRDLQLFRDIRPTEYVVDVFQLSDVNKPKQTANLETFTNLSNDEMFWVVTEVCSEHSITRRAKTIKHFIQIAKHCQEYKNFNSMFAIISGLGHGSVSRLHQTWDKVPSKWKKLFEDMQGVMDPSRNMAKYRNLINGDNAKPPMVPFFPLVMKDLTFIHLGNDSEVEGLVNFEKFCMIAAEIRRVVDLAPKSLEVSVSLSGASILRRQTSGTTMANPRKMFEELQMVRRVRAYLTAMKVQKDETLLSEMSAACEMPPQQSTQQTSSIPPVVRREPNAGAVVKLTDTSLSPKFGAERPDDVRKMLSLRDGIRPIDPKRSSRPPSTHLYVVPASPRNPSSTMAYSPSSVRSCPVGPSSESTSVAVDGQSTSSASTVDVQQLASCKDSGVAINSRSSSFSSSTGSAGSIRGRRQRISQSSSSLALGVAGPPTAPARRSRPSSLLGQCSSAEQTEDDDGAHVTCI